MICPGFEPLGCPPKYIHALHFTSSRPLMQGSVRPQEGNMTRWDLSTDGRYYDIRAHARHVAPTDFLPLVGFICFNCLLIAATPPTPAWKRVRAAVFPFMLSYQLWFVTSTYELPWYRCWGNATGQLWHTVKALEVLVFYPPEDHCYRIKPQGKETAKRNQLDVKDDAGRARENGHGVAVRDGDSSGMQAPPTLVPESIPPPFTLVKLYWAFSLWFSQRGIGWNYVAPLPASSMRHPFTRKSSRRAYLVNRVIYLLCVYLACNLTRAYMTCEYFTYTCALPRRHPRAAGVPLRVSRELTDSQSGPALRSSLVVLASRHHTTVYPSLSALSTLFQWRHMWSGRSKSTICRYRFSWLALVD